MDIYRFLTFIGVKEEHEFQFSENFRHISFFLILTKIAYFYGHGINQGDIQDREGAFEQPHDGPHAGFGDVSGAFSPG